MAEDGNNWTLSDNAVFNAHDCYCIFTVVEFSIFICLMIVTVWFLILKYFSSNDRRTCIVVVSTARIVALAQDEFHLTLVAFVVIAISS